MSERARERETDRQNYFKELTQDCGDLEFQYLQGPGQEVEIPAGLGYRSLELKGNLERESLPPSSFRDLSLVSESLTWGRLQHGGGSPMFWRVV